jgi:hypothetical protein
MSCFIYFVGMIRKKGYRRLHLSQTLEGVIFVIPKKWFAA